MPEMTLTERQAAMQTKASDFYADVCLLKVWASMDMDEVLALVTHLGVSLEAMQDMVSDFEEVVRRILATRAIS